jgi:hypothetical protein
LFDFSKKHENEGPKTIFLTIYRLFSAFGTYESEALKRPDLNHSDPQHYTYIQFKSDEIIISVDGTILVGEPNVNHGWFTQARETGRSIKIICLVVESLVSES